MDNNAMNKMLQTAGRKLGISADELKGLLAKGDMNAIMSKMPSDEAKKLKDALANPQVTKMMKDSPEMSDFMKNMKNQNKNK